MDDPALVTLCEREHARLVGLMVVLVGDAGTAEELAQEALLRLCERWPAVRRMERPEAWLTRVAVNLGRSRVRRRVAERRAYRRHGDTGAVWEPADAGVAVAVRQAVAGLPLRQRTAIGYRFYAGFDVAETARAMRVAPGTVRALTAQAVAALRAGGLSVDDEEGVDVAAG